MKLLLLVCVFLVSARPVFGAASPADSLLAELNSTLARKRQYDAQRWKQIAVLTAAYTSSKADNAKFNPEQ